MYICNIIRNGKSCIGADKVIYCLAVIYMWLVWTYKEILAKYRSKKQMMKPRTK